mmetsp:Transcript_1257/g.3383  ORF Transcript_1257/g.3383 Transcript_1257/m.3383 type:complete len:208 (-) Transcript_1257:85-708(-)
MTSNQEVSPSSELPAKLRKARLVKFPKLRGIVPPRPLYVMLRCSRRVSWPISSGIVPVRELYPSENHSSFWSIPISVGIDPTKEFSVLVIMASVLGVGETVPENRLRVTSSTRFPIVVGIVPVNPLLYKLSNRSSVRSPRRSEIVPWNLLAPREMALRLTSPKTPSGRLSPTSFRSKFSRVSPSSAPTSLGSFPPIPLRLSSNEVTT